MLAGLLLVAFVLGGSFAAQAAGSLQAAQAARSLQAARPQPAREALPAGPTPSPAISPLPAGPPPGVRNPVEGALAILAIVVAAAAGVFIYIVIRKGL